MEKFELFEKVTGRITLEKKKDFESLIKAACKNSGAEYHEAADAILVTGTLDQLVDIRNTVGRKPQRSNGRSGSSSSEHSEKAVSPSGNVQYDTVPYMVNYIKKFCDQELADIELSCNVRIIWSKDGTKVKIKCKDLGASNAVKLFEQACEHFTKLYQDLYHSVSKFTFNVSHDNREFSKEELVRAVRSVPQVVAGLILERAVDGKSYDLWGTSPALTCGQEWIRNQLGISSPQVRTRSLSPKALRNTLVHETPNKIKVVVYQGDITKEDTDIIVNASNEHLDHAGGVSWAISKAGGPSIQQESDSYVRKHGPLSTGGVAITGPGFLKCKYVAHAVGPQWKKYGKEKSVKLLKKLCSNIFDMAIQRKAKSVAMPAISSGIYGVPQDVCVQTILSCIDELDQRLASHPIGQFEIRLVNIDGETAKVFGQEFHKWKLKGGKVTRRNSFGGLKRTPDKEVVTKKSSDDMNIPAKMKGSLTINSMFTKFTGKKRSSSQSPQPSNTPSPPTTAQVRASPVSVAGPHGPGSGSRSTSSSSHLAPLSDRNHSNTSTAQSAFTQDWTEHDTHSSTEQLVNGGPGMHTRYSSSAKSSQFELRTSAQYGQNGLDSHTTGETSSSSDCPICKSSVTNPKRLSKCGHIFCTACIDTAFTFQKKCPVCQEIYGITEGDQPHGTMTVQRFTNSLPGYIGYGSFVITYTIPSGTQDSRHPKPGSRFHGTTRYAYLPATNEGEEVLKLLQKAFEKKLVFTVGRSTTTGIDDCVTWNDIHHKTSMYGGPQRFGYPDPDYLRRVKDELKAKGIVPE